MTIHYTPEDNSRRSIVLALISFLLSIYTILTTIVHNELDNDAAAESIIFAQAALLTGVISIQPSPWLQNSGDYQCYHE